MRIYKVVPAPGRVFAKDEEEAAKGISSLSNVIIQESVGGWELITTMPIVVSKSAKGGYAEEPYNALVFAKDVLKEYPQKPEDGDV